MDFEKLYNTYFMKIYSYVFTLVKAHDLAEEITQEVFFKAIKSRKQYEGKSSEYTWLCAIAKNTAFDELKKRNRHRELTEDLTDETDLQKSLIDSDTTLQIHKLLHELEEPYKEVFQLRIFGELSFANIGMIFSKTESWARVTYHRARLKLQEKMN